MDWLGAVLISLSLTALNIGVGGSSQETGAISGSAQGWFQRAWPFLAAALVLFILFLWRQVRLPYPLVQLPLFRRPNFSPATIANFFIGTSLFIAIANVPLFINTLVAENLEQGAWDSGWMLSGLTVPMALASIPGGWLTVRYGYRRPALLGLLLAIGGFALMSRWQMTTSYAAMTPDLILTGIGLGLTMAPIAAAAINTSPTQVSRHCLGPGDHLPPARDAGQCFNRCHIWHPAFQLSECEIPGDLQRSDPGRHGSHRKGDSRDLPHGGCRLYPGLDPGVST